MEDLVVIEAKSSEVTPYAFHVSVRDFEPMSGSRGKGKRLEKKQELTNKIASAKTAKEIGVAHDSLYGKRVFVRVLFYQLKMLPGFL